MNSDQIILEKDYKYLYLKYKSKYLLAKQMKLENNYGGSSDLNKLITTFKPYIKYIDNYYKTIEQLAEGSAKVASFISFGKGGDATVKFGLVALNAIQILDSIKNVEDLFSKSKNHKEIIDILLNSKFSGPDQIEKTFENLSKLIDKLDKKEEFVKKICKPIIELLEKSGNLIGNAISTGIPNDNFATSKLIQELIKKSIKDRTDKSFQSSIDDISKQYNKIPKDFRDKLQSSDKMADLINSTFNSIKKLNDAKNLLSRKKDDFGKIIDSVIANKNIISDKINSSIAMPYLILNLMKKYCLK